jgi:YD repeat-containing protein
MIVNKKSNRIVGLCLWAIIMLCLVFTSSSRAASVNISYTYDSLNRLTEVNYNQKTAAAYNYDATGNITNIQTTIIPDTYSLTITKTGSGAGAITSNPEGINCGAACTADFASGAQITLTASAAAGSVFLGWAGGVCSGTGACAVSMDAAKNISASFALKPVIPTPPVEGLIGSTVTIDGSNFGATQGSGYVDFNGIHGAIVSWSDTRIVATVPEGAASGCLQVVTDHGASDCVDFNVMTEILYGHFTGAGIWKWNGKTWTQATPSNPDLMVASGSILYGSFPQAGIWIYDGATWSQATPDNPQKMATAGSTLYGSFAGAGIWKWNGESWMQATPDNPDLMMTSGSLLYGSFPQAGIWIYDGAAWRQATPDNPQKMATVGSTLYGSFGDAGIWKWNGESWMQATPGNPQQMTASKNALYGAFPGVGLWKYDGADWTQLTPDIPAAMVVGE